MERGREEGDRERKETEKWKETERERKETERWEETVRGREKREGEREINKEGQSERRYTCV